MAVLGTTIWIKKSIPTLQKVSQGTYAIPTFSSPSLESNPNFLIGLNGSSAEQLQKISGIGPVLSQRIVKYRSAIKGFKKLEELKKVYGISEDQYADMVPFLYLDSFPEWNIPNIPPTQKPQKNLSRTEINSANAQEFQQFPGIGKVLSNRIIQYRKALGYFRTVNELAKVYKLPDSTFRLMYPYLYIDSTLLQEKQITRVSEAKKSFGKIPTIETDSFKIQPININQADSSTWANIPGISPHLARRIVLYRNIIGFYSQVEYLKNVYGFPADLFQRLSPFLRVGELDTFTKLDLNTVSPKKLKKYPFWQEKEWDSFTQWKKQIRRVDAWEEVEKSQTISPSTLTQLKSYFKL